MSDAVLIYVGIVVAGVTLIDRVRMAWLLSVYEKRLERNSEDTINRDEHYRNEADRLIDRLRNAEKQRDIALDELDRLTPRTEQSR